MVSKLKGPPGMGGPYLKNFNAPVPVATFLVVAGILAFIQVVAERPLLVAERYIPGAGWIEIILLAMYAAWISQIIQDVNNSAVIRKRIWGFFSIVFFTQLLLGLVGYDRFLMSGQLHLPIPVVIVAGPLYRGEGSFMLVLLSVTLVLVGPAWCSYFCYMGSWDSGIACMKKKPENLPAWRYSARLVILILIFSTAFYMNRAGVSNTVAIWSAVVFGIIGIIIMLTWSRVTGSMTHCVVYCPISFITNYMGKISPFRIKIKDGCNECGACTVVCRYDSLNKADLKRKQVGISCTLCGDCLSSCAGQHIEYAYLRFNPVLSRNFFIVLVISWHAISLGVARL